MWSGWCRTASSQSGSSGKHSACMAACSPRMRNLGRLPNHNMKSNAELESSANFADYYGTARARLLCPQSSLTPQTKLLGSGCCRHTVVVTISHCRERRAAYSVSETSPHRMLRARTAGVAAGVAATLCTPVRTPHTRTTCRTRLSATRTTTSTAPRTDSSPQYGSMHSLSPSPPPHTPSLPCLSCPVLSCPVRLLTCSHLTLDERLYAEWA